MDKYRFNKSYYDIVDPIIIKRGWLEFDTVEDYEKYNEWLREGSLNRFLELR